MPKPLFKDNWLELYVGDVREVLRSLPAESVQCVITSPPYWGLRSYLADDDPNKELEIGRERSPNAYVATMVDVFREVRRVLRKDGVLWLNIGDSYAAERGGTPMPAETLSGGEGGNGDDETRRGRGDHDTFMPHRKASAYGLKHKDLVGIPWRIALALQEDGWWLRSDVIWEKPNPMPESVTDRPSRNHEYIFLLAKSERYFYDMEATRVPHLPITLARIEYGLKQTHPDGIGVAMPPLETDRMGERFANPGGRNMRTVWNVATQSYPGVHYATFPEKLIEPMILSGTSEKGCCPTCGAPWERIVETSNPSKWAADDNTLGWANTHQKTSNPQSSKSLHRQPGGVYSTAVSVGWRPGCDHGEEPIPCTVLDVFLGSGTTARVAMRLGRRAIGIDLNPDYYSQQLKRTSQTPLGL